MSARLVIEHKQFDRLAQVRSMDRLTLPDKMLSFDALRAKCDDLQGQIEDAWSQAKTESFSRCHTLGRILKSSRQNDCVSWKQYPGYKQVQTKLAELRLTDKGSTYDSHMKVVRNLLNESKDSQIPLKALLSPSIGKMLAKHRRKFGEHFKFQDSIRPCKSSSPVRSESPSSRHNFTEAQLRSINLSPHRQNESEPLSKQDCSEEVQLRNISPRQRIRGSPDRWKLAKLSLANKIVFESTRTQQTNKWTERKEIESSLPPISQVKSPRSELNDKSLKHKRNPKKRVSEACSPKMRSISYKKEEAYMYKEAERELKDLKSRFNMERMVNERKRKDKKEGCDILKIISPSSMKILDQIKY